MRISVLGPLRVTEGGRAVSIGGPRQRAVLSFLLLHTNQVVAPERLVDELWGRPTPASAGNALQAAVSRLRKVLPAGRLVTTPQGYLLRATPEEVDLTEFDQAFARGTRALADGAADDAAVVLASALTLWRGPALVDVQFEPFAQAEIARLEEARLACREARLDADLTLGGGADLIGEIQHLVADNPLREKLTGQLMVALYRAGRQAEALEAFRRTRDLLAEELGIDPSQTLSRLEAAILRQESWLDSGPPWPPAAGTTVGAESVLGPSAGPGADAGPPLRSRPAAAVGAVGTVGAGVAPRPPVATASRRPVSVVCLEVALAGDAGQWADPEMLHLVNERVRALVSPVLERHGGRLLPGQGQSLVGVFGAVPLHADDARRAAAAALECCTAVTDVPDPPLSCRVGVATAEALVSDADPLSFVGDAGRTARALAEHSAPGQVLIGARTYQLAAAALDADPVPDQDAYRLHGVRLGARSLPLRLEVPVVGRSAELGRVEEICATARHRRTSAFITVVGDAGMGKSRLIHELRGRLAGTTRFVTGRCLPYGDGATFWPLGEIVEQLAGGRDAPAVAAALTGEPDAEVVAERLVRAFGAGEAGSADAAEIFWATRRLVETAARERPLVVVLEDLHWAEPTLLDLVESIALQPGAVPLVVLCVTRPDLLQDRPDWLSAAATHVVVQLPPLADVAAAALADELAGPGELPDELRSRLVTAAGGNPLYLEQLVAATDEQPPGERGTETPMPPTLQALLASRLHRLGPAEREVVAAAAVVGKDFGSSAVAALLPAQIESRLAWHLRTLVTKLLLAPPGDGAPHRESEQHSFRHILVQQAAYRAIPKATRAGLHEQLADWAESAAGPSPADGKRVEILAHHLTRAAGYYRELAQSERAGALVPRAVAYLQQSGHTSLDLGDAAAAVSAFERTLSLLTPQHTERSAILVGLAAALVESGRLTEARAVLDQAGRLAREDGDSRVTAQVLVQSLQLDLHLDPDGAVDRVESALPDVRTALTDASDDAGLCRAWMLEASVHWHRARSEPAERAWEKAAEAARAAGDRRHLTRSLRWLASAALWGPTPATQGLERCRAYLAEIGSTPTGRAVVQLHMAGLHGMLDELSVAQGLLSAGTASLRDVGSALPMVLAEPAAFVAMLVEDFAAAERHLSNAYDVLRGMGEQVDSSTCAALLARAVAVQSADPSGYPLPRFDREDDVQRHVRAGRTAAGGQDLSARIVGNGALARVLSVRGAVHGRPEDVATALDLARDAVHLAEGTDLVNQHADALLDLAHVLRAAGRDDEAVSTITAARTLYRNKQNRLAARQCDRFLAASR